MESRKKSVRFLVTGRVQGVGFRRFVKKKADELRLSGWTRNLVDGRVEIQVQGVESEIEKLQKQVEKGPLFSHVENVLIQNISDESIFNPGFEIRPDGGNNDR